MPTLPKTKPVGFVLIVGGLAVAFYGFKIVKSS